MSEQSIRGENIIEEEKKNEVQPLKPVENNDKLSPLLA